MHEVVGTGNKSARTSNNESFTATQVTFLCQVCNELARGYHFGAFTCEGCKSFFGRTCKPSKESAAAGGAVAVDRINGNRTKVKLHCKNGGKCDVQGRNRTSCKFCRFNKCIEVGMAPQNSRYGRRSKYFKVSSVLEAQERARMSCPEYPQHSAATQAAARLLVTSPSAQFIRPAAALPAPVWAFPAVCLSASIVSIQDILTVNNNNDYYPKEPSSFVETCPQTEPLDLSVRK